MPYLKLPQNVIVDLDAFDSFIITEQKGYRDSEKELNDNTFIRYSPKKGAKGYTYWILALGVYSEGGVYSECENVEIYHKGLRDLIQSHLEEKLNPLRPDWSKNIKPK